jgi:hypothetical protein
LNRRVSDWVAGLLAHRAGFLAFNIFTLLWFAVPVTAGLLLGGTRLTVTALVVATTAYLDVVTWFSGATQFTLGFQNAQAADKLDEALATLLQLARSDAADGDALIAQGEAIQAALQELQRGRRR